MSQVDKIAYLPMIFFFLMFFIILYFIIFSNLLPYIFSSFFTRNFLLIFVKNSVVLNIFIIFFNDFFFFNFINFVKFYFFFSTFKNIKNDLIN